MPRRVPELSGGRPVGVINNDRVKRQYRNRLEIAADIIEITKNGSRKTRIMYQGNLSFDLLQRYLDMLLNFQLIQRLEGDQPAYIATEKGRHFLTEFEELRRYSAMAENKRRALEQTLNMPRGTPN